MAAVRRIHRRFIAPAGVVFSQAVSLNTQIWSRLFWDRWEPLPLDEKLTWLFFVGNTIGIFTLIELLFLK